MRVAIAASDSLTDRLAVCRAGVTVVTAGLGDGLGDGNLRVLNVTLTILWEDLTALRSASRMVMKTQTDRMVSDPSSKTRTPASVSADAVGKEAMNRDTRAEKARSSDSPP